MSADTVGDIFDERGTEIAACPLGCPFRYGMHSKIVVAVDPERGDAEAETARSEGAGAAAGDALEGRDRLLIVNDIEYYRSLAGGNDPDTFQLFERAWEDLMDWRRAREAREWRETNPNLN